MQEKRAAWAEKTGSLWERASKGGGGSGSAVTSTIVAALACGPAGFKSISSTRPACYKLTPVGSPSGRAFVCAPGMQTKTLQHCFVCCICAKLGSLGEAKVLRKTLGERARRRERGAGRLRKYFAGNFWPSELLLAWPECGSCSRVLQNRLGAAGQWTGFV